MSRLGRLRALPPAERRLLAEALALLPLTAAGLRLAGLRRMQLLLGRGARLPRARSPCDAASIARAVSIAARHGPFRARCLASALTLQSLLDRHGIAAELRLGVRKRAGRVEAHAWVEHAGRPLMDSSGFLPFDGAIQPRA